MENQLKRVRSIDVFRALTMLLMIFVNDLWSLSGIPYWLEHAKADEDFLGLADVVFPCFLFILGMAIPFAIQNRIAKGESEPEIVKHIIIRSVALLIMGIFTVNVPDINARATGISSQWFQILMVIGFFLIWNVYPKANGSKKMFFHGLQIAGIILLVFLTVIFKRGEQDHLTGMLPAWWGILGLIGWTYLVSALIYLFFRQKPVLLIASWLFFTIFTIASHSGFLQSIWKDGPRDWILGNGAFHAFAFAGIMATLLLEKYYTHESKTKLPLIYVLAGFAFLIAGFAARNFFIISKIHATPTWIFLCCGIAFIFFALVYWVVDLKGKNDWFSPIKPAGTSTLTCYLIPYLYYSLADLSGIALPGFLKYGLAGLVKSLIYAFIVIGITAALGKINIKLKI